VGVFAVVGIGVQVQVGSASGNAIGVCVDAYANVEMASFGRENGWLGCGERRDS
jgi:hypothetical protein